jgi:ParB family transcriptional regulator, chromosome partitioning protein
MKGGLGRGLSALIPSKPAAAEPAVMPASAPSALPKGAVEVVPPGDRILHVPVGDIVANPYQPRREFHPEELEELVASVKEFGILQPLVVTEKPNGMFELIAGERRLRSAREAGLKKVPVIVRSASEQQKLELALIENIQRSDLSPIEEAHSYAKLMEEFGLTQERVAERVGKSRSAVANTLRLLNLPAEMQLALTDGRISMSMARVLCGMDDVKERKAMFERMLQGDFNVRQAEAVSRERKGGKAHSSVKDVNLLAVEEELRRALGTKVAVQKKGPNGRITIEFYSDEEFKDIVGKLRG